MEDWIKPNVIGYLINKYGQSFGTWQCLLNPKIFSIIGKVHETSLKAKLRRDKEERSELHRQMPHPRTFVFQAD